VREKIHKAIAEAFDERGVGMKDVGFGDPGMGEIGFPSVLHRKVTGVHHGSLTDGIRGGPRKIIALQKPGIIMLSGGAIHNRINENKACIAMIFD
jgi:hypothetical protein